MQDRKAEVSRRVFELAAEHGGVEVSRITPDTHFVNDLNFDSLSAVEFTMDIEDEFEIAVPDDDATKFQTAGQVVEYVLAHATSDRPVASGDAK
ncbi:MAG TPA: acyl carrier protein [Tepidisphaeraceae bacterium]|jgi:acyl carrier protein